MTSRFTQFQRVRRESGLPWAATLAAEHLGLPVFQRLWGPRLVEADRLRAQVHAILVQWGMNTASAELCAAHIVYADLRGIDGHGAAMMPFYQRRLASKRLNLNPDIVVVEDSPGTALVDGGGGLGHLSGDFAIELAIEKARQSGVAAVGVRNSWHFGAAGAYAAKAAAEGMIALVTTATPTPSVIPTNGTEPLLGTNPIAFLAPGLEGSMFALDMATSTASRGKLLDRWRRHGALPEGWAVNRRGFPVRNGRRAFEQRRLAPLGGSPSRASHKGYGLAVMVEILSNVLTGARDQTPLPEAGIGHFFLAMDPDRFRTDDGFKTGVSDLLSKLRASPTVSPDEPVLVAGDPEEQTRCQRSRDGIPLSRHVFEDLRLVARDCDTDFLLDRS